MAARKSLYPNTSSIVLATPLGSIQTYPTHSSKSGQAVYFNTFQPPWLEAFSYSSTGMRKVGTGWWGSRTCHTRPHLCVSNRQNRQNQIPVLFSPYLPLLPIWQSSQCHWAMVSNVIRLLASDRLCFYPFRNCSNSFCITTAASPWFRGDTTASIDTSETFSDIQCLESLQAWSSGRSALEASIPKRRMAIPTLPPLFIFTP